jgi:hypothetical protein
MARVLVSRVEGGRWRQGMGGSSDWVKAEEAAIAMDLQTDMARSSCCGEEMCARVNTDGCHCVRWAVGSKCLAGRTRVATVRASTRGIAKPECLLITLICCKNFVILIKRV